MPTSIDRVTELEVRKFQASYKLVLLAVHAVLITSVAWLAKPFIKVGDFFNETYPFTKVDDYFNERFQKHLDKK